MAIRFPSKTTRFDLPPEDGPTPDELVDFDREAPAAVPRTGVPAPRRLAPGDAVPIFRTDLEIARGASAGLFEVGDPATGRHFTLYEFELSVARMLDGRRHASDVIENGVRLGIPVDLDGLDKFVRQLWRYGFLAPPGAPAPAEAGEGGWGERGKWDEATRTLFQTGLRLMRQGRPQDAVSYFRAVLDADPGNAEALEHVATIERGESVPATPIGQRPDAPEAGRRRGPGRWIAVAALGLAAVGGGAAFVVWRRTPPPPPPPPPRLVQPPPKPAPPAWRTAAVQRRAHPLLAEVTAPEGGVVIWKKRDGAAVKQGERIGRVRVGGGAKGAGKPDPATAARIRELEALAKQDPIYADFLEKERRKARGAGQRSRDLSLVAPEAGLLAIAVEGKGRAAPGDVVATIVDGRVWIVDAFLDGSSPPEGAACELRGDAVAERIPCRLDGVEAQAGGSQLTLTTTNEEAPWLEGSRSLRVRIAPPGTPAEPGATAKDP